MEYIKNPELEYTRKQLRRSEELRAHLAKSVHLLLGQRARIDGSFTLKLYLKTMSVEESIELSRDVLRTTEGILITGTATVRDFLRTYFLYKGHDYVCDHRHKNGIVRIDLKFAVLQTLSSASVNPSRHRLVELLTDSPVQSEVTEDKDIGLSRIRFRLKRGRQGRTKKEFAYHLVDHIPQIIQLDKPRRTGCLTCRYEGNVYSIRSHARKNKEIEVQVAYVCPFIPQLDTAPDEAIDVTYSYDRFITPDKPVDFIERESIVDPATLSYDRIEERVAYKPDVINKDTTTLAMYATTENHAATLRYRQLNMGRDFVGMYAMGSPKVTPPAEQDKMEMTVAIELVDSNVVTDSAIGTLTIAKPKSPQDWTVQFIEDCGEAVKRQLAATKELWKDTDDTE